VLALGTAAAAAGPAVYRVEPALTMAEFSVSHFGLWKPRWRFDRTQGTIVLDPEQHSGSIDFVIDAASVDTGWSVRDSFLRGKEMFDAERYPEVRFRSTALVFDRERLIGVAGELTLRNVTRPVALRIDRLHCGREGDGEREGCGAGVATSIKGSDFGMSYASALISDDIDLSFQVTAFRVPPQSEAQRR
jgi:polyisoprenoid-binding protein YceI